jgi:hypothetical protein
VCVCVCVVRVCACVGVSFFARSEKFAYERSLNNVPDVAIGTAHQLKVDESAEKFRGASGAACMAGNARKAVNAHGEFVIGLKRTSERRETFPLKWSTTLR